MKQRRGAEGKGKKNNNNNDQADLIIPKRRFRFEEIGVLSALLVIGVILSFGSPYFLTANNIFRVGRQVAFFGLLAIGQAIVIASGQIDISVGRIITFVTFASASIIQMGVNPWLAFVLGILLGGVCGLINGGLTLIFNVHPMIITLGTLNLYWGLAIGLSDARPIVLWQETSFLEFGPGKVLGVPNPLVVLILIVVIGNIVLKKTRFGRHVLAVGSNKQAAVYAGINEKRIRLAVMVLNGMIAGLSAGVTLSFFQTYDPNIGANMEMDAIGAAVIGGADLMGGYASILGAFLGSFLIGILRNGLVLMGVGAYWNNFVTGAVILIAVAVSAFLRLKRK